MLQIKGEVSFSGATKEFLAGYSLIEADSMEEAVRMAEAWPWSRYGAVEVRPVRDFDAVRRRVGA